MVALSILGLSWCQHAGWMVVLYDASGGRRLQVTLPAEDAVVVGRELARQPSERTNLYALVGALLRQEPRLASLSLTLADANRARASLVVRADDGDAVYPTSTADAVALAVRVGLPLYADEALLAAFGVADEPGPGRNRRRRPDTEADVPGATPIPPAFRRALEPPAPEA